MSTLVFAGLATLILAATPQDDADQSERRSEVRVVTFGGERHGRLDGQPPWRRRPHHGRGLTS